MNMILEVNGLNKKLGAFSLNNISFNIPEGCIAGFIGTNGAGKTTTIKTILGLVHKDIGCIKLFGKDLEHNERELKNNIGVVFDEGYFYEDLSLEDMKNIIAPAYSNWDEKVYKSNISQFNLDKKQKISTLSKGMRMKFAISLALSHHSKLLIMDEPTSGLDPLVRSELMELILEFMKKEGLGVLFSSHVTSDLDKIADILILIDNGKILLHEEKDILLDMYGLAKGDNRELNEATRRLFIRINETPFGFSGLTAKKSEVRQLMKSVHIERPTIEDIMLGYIGR